MRVPLIIGLDSRDGLVNKDARQTNTLGEEDTGVTFATIRPGLQTIATASGIGSGLVSYSKVLVSVFGTTVGYGETPTTIGTVATGDYDFAQSPP